PLRLRDAGSALPKLEIEVAALEERLGEEERQLARAVDRVGQGAQRRLELAFLARLASGGEVLLAHVGEARAAREQPSGDERKASGFLEHHSWLPESSRRAHSRLTAPHREDRG